MNNKQYLTFCLHNLQYGIEAALVQELFPLPELTPIIESSVDLIGILNLRGQIVPIIHLDLLQGNSVNGCHLSDYVIAVQSEGLQFGLIAHQVHEVVEINTEVVESESPQDFPGNIDTTLISGIAKRDEGYILLLNLKTLIPKSDALFTLIWDAQSQLDSMGTSANSEEQQLEQVIL
ncbi:MAG TPA: chemotaxis protein CheW, partial [Coleofasciculaceae cyanobacterium]